MGTTKDNERALERIEADLSKIGYALPGTLSVQAYRCGKTNCRCHTDPGALHGPYAYWTRKVGRVTKSRALTAEQLAEYQGWFDNARRLKALVQELYDLAVSILDEDPRRLRSRRPENELSGHAKRPAEQSSGPRQPA